MGEAPAPRIGDEVRIAAEHPGRLTGRYGRIVDAELDGGRAWWVLVELDDDGGREWVPAYAALPTYGAEL